MSRWGDSDEIVSCISVSGSCYIEEKKCKFLSPPLSDYTRKWDQMVTKMFEFHVRSAIIYTCSSPPLFQSPGSNFTSLTNLRRRCRLCAALCRIFTSSLYVSFLLAVKVILMSKVLLRVAQSLDIGICRVCAPKNVASLLSNFKLELWIIWNADLLPPLLWLRCRVDRLFGRVLR